MPSGNCEMKLDFNTSELPMIEVAAVQFGQSNTQRIISLGLLIGLLSPTFQAWAGDDFGANWQPKPLVDTSAPPAQTQAKASDTPSAQPVVVQPDLEAKLKPVEPLVKEIENRLTLTPKPGVTMVQRLNTLQTVLFGTQQYQDAGQLIARLVEIFPQEAQKAQLEMDRQAQQIAQAQNASKVAKPTTPEGIKSTNKAVPAGSTVANIPNMQSSMQNTAQPSTPKKKRRGFWNTDDFSSDFDNDPFFQDAFQGRLKTSAFQAGSTAQMQSQASQHMMPPSYNTSVQQQGSGPSRLASMAQGLAGVALAVGGLAGAYYLNNKMAGKTSNYPYNGSYGNPYGYGYSPYGVPYTYGNANIPYGAPMYGNLGGMNPYNAVPFMGNGTLPYGRTIPFGTTGQAYSYTPGFGQTMPGVTQYFGY